ncbi:PilZ domain-containing protein [Thalassomonas actiniarum]|uniref:PilZ domain-containing protein n=1 Tax=Thalassomonas actiniarum TaxID=485447 RepID=A0AAF0C5Z4_9GAMM|nr:PilZ domain-containing protein [Thalassomonas actiniarum]WDE01425.1 PilZ domain-containing protein [Thalassomonas actiniarum]
MVTFDDKRNFYRMMLNSEVTITIIDDEANRQMTATCRDMSAEGMAIEMDYPLDIGTRVRVKVESSTQSIQSLDAKGRVIRVKEESADCYLVGIKIDDMD